MAASILASVAIGNAVAHAKQVIDRASPRSANSAWRPSLAPDGHPDLQGVWVNNSATPLERPVEVEGRTSLNPDEVAALNARAARFQADNSNDFAGGDNFFRAVWLNVQHYKSLSASGGVEWQSQRVFDNRTSLIVDPPDGRVPTYTAEGRRRLDGQTRANTNTMPEGPEELANYVRCLTYGTPRLGGSAADYSNYYQVVQTATHVLVFGEAIHSARVVPLDGRPHLPGHIRLWDGDSRGKWEGQTLVVDTTNFLASSRFMGAADHLHLTERFSRTDADTLTYEITLEDVTTWTRPWTAVINLKRTTDQIYEFACHEGSLHTIEGLLGAARAAERETAGKR